MQEISGKAQDPTRLQNKCLLIYFSAACILFFPIFGRLICNGHFMQYIYKLNEWLFSVGIFFRFGKVNWKEEISNLVRVALWSITAGPRLGLIVPTRAQTRASRRGVVLLFPNWPFTWGAWAMSSPPSCPIVLCSKEHSRQNSQKPGGQISLFCTFSC